MAVKVIFVGNPLGGDDGIGPYLFNELKDNPILKNFELLELGVIGLDMISYVNDYDKLIIVDAVRSGTDSKCEIGTVKIYDEKDLTPDFSLVSQHDFGVEQTAAILRFHLPKLKKINVVGISVQNVNAFNDKLSEGLIEKLPNIKEQVIKSIITCSKI